MNCRNPECRNGQTPGVVIVGKGSAKTPVIGQTMRWAWVRCLACSANDEDSKGDARYKHVSRTPDEIARRAELATSKAIYQQPSAINKSLGAIRAQVPQAPMATSNSPTTDPGALAKLLEQVSQLNQTIMKLTNQVTDLLEDNRSLRKQLEGTSSAPAQPQAN